jgi:hypothetical protein
VNRALAGVWNRRVAALPDAGILLVATDLQGNLGDYERMKALYAAERAAGHAPILAFVGDLVLRLDLAARYASVHDLRAGHEVRPLYG